MTEAPWEFCVAPMMEWTDLVHAIKRDFPRLNVVLNGGITTWRKRKRTCNCWMGL